MCLDVPGQGRLKRVGHRLSRVFVRRDDAPPPGYDDSPAHDASHGHDVKPAHGVPPVHNVTPSQDTSPGPDPAGPSPPLPTGENTLLPDGEVAKIPPEYLPLYEPGVERTRWGKIIEKQLDKDYVRDHWPSLKKGEMLPNKGIIIIIINASLYR